MLSTLTRVRAKLPKREVGTSLLSYFGLVFRYKTRKTILHRYSTKCILLKVIKCYIYICNNYQKITAKKST